MDRTNRDDLCEEAEKAQEKASESAKMPMDEVSMEKDGDNGSMDDAKDDDIEQIEPDILEMMQEELATEKEKYLRLAAEYDNFRKRTAKERETVYVDSRADVITRLLPIYDNLERALKTECSDEAFYKGVEMTMTLMTEALASIGVEPIFAVGEKFDPNLHNAVMTIENPEYGEKIIAEEYQKGFVFGDKVLRFSTVVVAN